MSGPDVPRPEHPRPDLARAAWRNLNGTWELAYDAADRGERDGWETGRPFGRRVVVPFPIEAELSGVGDREPPPVLWYRREVELDAADLGARTALRLGACDYETDVFVNGRHLGHHRGGYDPIECEAGPALRPGHNEVVLRVADPGTWTRPRGKQAAGAFRTPVDYDPVTGPWQTVWLESRGEVSVDALTPRFSLARGELLLGVVLSEPFAGEVEATLSDGERTISERTSALSRPHCALRFALPRARLWSPESPFLHDLRVRLLDGGRVLDEVTSPVGLREIAVDGGRILLNGEPRTLRGVLDQGYFPGGWYTAPDDATLRRDVELTRALGFDLARKHQKLEDPRWLHWADRLGLLVWGEMPSGRDFGDELATDLVAQWTSALRRDRSHPSIVAWVPFNESWGVWDQARRPEQRALVEGVVGLTRALDPTRLVVGNDGWEYAAGDLFTLHLYEGEGTGGRSLRERLRALLADPWADVLPENQPLGRRRGALPGADPRGLPVLLTECGGVGYVAPGEERPPDLFAYGDLPATPDELERRIRGVADAVAACPELSGFVWTQLTDVQQERNGLLTFDREPKLPLATLRGIFEGMGHAIRPT